MSVDDLSDQKNDFFKRKGQVETTPGREPIIDTGDPEADAYFNNLYALIKEHELDGLKDTSVFTEIANLTTLDGPGFKTAAELLKVLDKELNQREVPNKTN